MRAAVTLIFFMSGVSALIFETLWFRLAGIALGTSVWSAALVLCGFMGGIALGNLLVMRYGARIVRPILVYVVLEVIIGLTGFALVLIFPVLPAVLGTAFGPLTDTPWLLNLSRLGIAFALLVVPTTAMGATLAVLVKAMSRHSRKFGAILGGLYGANTLGAVCGALIGEVMLIEWLGVIGTGLAAALLNLLAAVIALAIVLQRERHDPQPEDVAEPMRVASLPLVAQRFLAVAFLSGAVMLALEVVWFRFLLLAHDGTSLIFAVMLAVVLAGIGLGGLLAGLMYRFYPQAHRHLRHVLLASGVLLVICYYGFDVFSLQQTQQNTSTAEFILFASYLMFPVSLLSGVTFTLNGRAMKDHVGVPIRTTGAVALFNTLGAAVGSFLGGFVLLPLVGMETSLFLLAAAYGVTALLVPRAAGPSTQEDVVYTSVATAAFVGCLVFFPFGLMTESYFEVQSAKYPAHKLVEARESRTGTLFYYRVDKFDQPLFYRLATNGFSMSATSMWGRRYMKLYVYLPLALQPDIEDALLISYGVGSTAKALTDTSTIRSVDVVDISREIVDMSAIVFPEVAERPLSDPRATLHVEDGRFFLNATDKRYDLITSEPPPPKMAGVVNLYSQEYFELIYDRLAEGGYATYWLPNRELNSTDSLSIIKAFCNAFEDCSLWTGMGLDWMLMGSRNAPAHKSVAQFSAQWQDPVVGSELKALGFETPAQMGSLFIADNEDLAAMTTDVLPVTDNYPLRISPDLRHASYSPVFAAMMNENDRLERFRDSAYIDRIWPDELRRESERYFRFERTIRNYVIPVYRDDDFYRWEEVDRVLTQTNLETLALWLLDSEADTLRIIRNLGERGELTASMGLDLGVANLAQRNYAQALEHLHRYFTANEWQFSPHQYSLYLYTAAKSGNLEHVRQVVENTNQEFVESEPVREFLRWLDGKFEMAFTLTPRRDDAMASSNDGSS